MRWSLPFTAHRVRPTVRRPGRWVAKSSLVLAFALAAFVFGVIGALFGGLPAVFLLVVILPLVLTFRDYRVGVVALTILLPWTGSPLLPQAQGFNLINFFTLATSLSFGVHVILRRKAVVHLPRVVWWCYLVPMSIGLLVAWPHLHEAMVTAGVEGPTYAPGEFLKGRYIKPLFLAVYAFLLANAVRESKRPDRWLVVFGASATVLALSVAAMIAVYRVSLTELQAMRGFIGPTGHHANGMAWMLVSALGPLLYATAAVRGPARVAALLVTGSCVAALAFTFSRGGFAALLVVLLMFAISRKRVAALLIVVALVVAGLLTVPAIQERVFTGVETGAVGKAATSSTGSGDTLTAGRLSFWPVLAREVLRSPVWGRGIGSTVWSEAARNGTYTAGHPHQLFLQIAMDLGLAGLGLMLYLFYRIGSAYARLSREPSLAPPMRAFFAGALASMVGCAVMGVTTGAWWEPIPENTFLWFSLGLTAAWWPLGQAAPAAAGASRRPWVFGIRPMPQRYTAVGKPKAAR